MLKELFHIISTVTATMLILMSFFLFTYKKQKQLANKILAAFLLTNAIYIINFLLFSSNGYLAKYKLDFFRIGIPFRFLFGPLLYFYTRALIYKDFKLNKKRLLHLIPFLVEYVLLFFTFYIHNHDAKIEILKSPGSLYHQIFWPIYWIFNLHVLTYIFVCLGIINHFRRKSTDFHSSLDHIKLAWLQIILWGFILMWLVDLVMALIFLTTRITTHTPLFHVISVCINLISIILLFYYSFNHPHIFSILDDLAKGKKYEKSALTPELKKIYLKKIEHYMEKEKPYLLYSLTLQDLSDQISISPNYLSQIINEVLNQNFFDFINAYRIDEAKKLLRNDHPGKKSIFQLYTDLGFNSKSTFYKAFRKHTGMTPIEYRKLHHTER